MGTKDGSIMATIMTVHMPRKDAEAPVHVCPGIRIHAIDRVQPPGIGISLIADMDSHQWIVTAVLATKSSAEMPKKARSEARAESTTLAHLESRRGGSVFVVPVPPLVGRGLGIALGGVPPPPSRPSAVRSR